MRWQKTIIYDDKLMEILYLNEHSTVKEIKRITLKPDDTIHSGL